MTADRRRGFVLTCAHLFSEGTGKVSVKFPDGSCHGALLIGIDRQADLAALEISNPRASPVGVSLACEQNVNYVACGFGPTGAFACAAGRGLGETPGAGRVSLRIAGGVRSGDSGGGVFDASGRLAAVVWGTAGGVTYASSGPPLQRFLQRHLGRRFARVVSGQSERLSLGSSVAQAQGGCITGRCPVPSPPRLPPPSNPRPAPRAPPSNCRCGDLRERLDQLEKQQAQSAMPPEPESIPVSREAALLGRARRLRGPAIVLLLAAGSLGGWRWATRRQRSASAKPTPPDKPEASCAEATAAAEGNFPAEESLEVELRSPIERDDRETRQLLRLSQLEGRDPLQDALAGRLALDRLDEVADRDVDSPEARWADALRRELRERFNDVAPTKFEVSEV